MHIYRVVVKFEKIKNLINFEFLKKFSFSSQHWVISESEQAEWLTKMRNIKFLP